MQVSPAGKSSVFAHVTTLPAGQACPGGIGLTIAPNGDLVVVNDGTNVLDSALM